MSKYSTNDLKLAFAYGICWCGAPRDTHTITDTKADGKTVEHRSLVCSAVLTTGNHRKDPVTRP